MEPFVIGPLDEPEVLVRARQHRAKDSDAQDGLYAVSLDAEGNLRVEPLRTPNLSRRNNAAHDR